MVITRSRQQSLKTLVGLNSKHNELPPKSNILTSNRESRDEPFHRNTPSSHSSDSIQSILLFDDGDSLQKSNPKETKTRRSPRKKEEIPNGLDTNLSKSCSNHFTNMTTKKISSSHTPLVPTMTTTTTTTTNTKRHKNIWMNIIMKGILYFTGSTFLFLMIFFSEGISMLFHYRKSFGSLAPIPIAPAYGVVLVVPEEDVLVVDDDHDHGNYRNGCFTKIPIVGQGEKEEENNPSTFVSDKDTFQNYMFPSFSTTTTTKSNTTSRINPSYCYYNNYKNNINDNNKQHNACSKKPIRLLFLGDSIARGVGSSVPYPILPESTAKTISKFHGGRPVFWSVFAEPGSTIKGTYMQVSQMNKHPSSHDLKDLIQHHWNEFYKEVSNEDEQDEIEDDEKEPDMGVNLLKAKKQWVEKLHHHQELQRLHPFVGYDFIVILSGVNDIKRLLVPFLFSGDDESRWIHRDDGENGFRGDLRRLIRSLNTTMPLDTSSATTDLSRYPKFILPSFPAKQVPAKMGSILNFIGVQSTKLMDQMKRQIAEEFSEQILAPPEISTEQGVDYIQKQGQIWNMLKEDDLKVQLVSIGEEHARQLTKKMIEFYEHNRADRKDMPWNPLMSNDALHPNEYGYDMAGRVIGMETSKRWSIN